MSLEDCLLNPFLLGPETVCAVCLANPVFQPPYRQIGWQPSFTAVCLQHEQPVLLTDTCLRGGSVAASVLKGHLPQTARYHSRTRQCAGCDLAEVVPVLLDRNDLGVVAQEILQTKLAARDGVVSPIASRLLECDSCPLAPEEFWKLLKFHVTMASFLVAAAPTHVYEPLGHRPPIRTPVRLGGFPMAGSAYAKHCLLTTAVMSLCGQLPFDEVISKIALHQHSKTGQLDLPEILLRELERQPQLLRDARKSLSSLYHTCVPLDSILAQRGQPEVPGERLAAQARNAGIHVVSLDLSAEGTQTLCATPEDVPRLATLEYYCAAPGCGCLAVRGHDDFLYCAGHENRCSVLTCDRFAQQGNFCAEHSGVIGSMQARDLIMASYTVSAQLRMPPVLRSSSRSGRRHRCIEIDCDKWQNWRYRKYCAKHGREKGLEPMRKYCRDPGCLRQSHTAHSAYCTRHARQHGIPIPVQCVNTSCRRVAKVNGLCEVCANGGVPSQIRLCVMPNCPELGTFKRHWLCVVHFKESKLEAAGQSCAIPECDLKRNIGYGQFCTQHGQENGLLLRRLMCRAIDCQRRAALTSIGYCTRHCRELGIKIPKYHCSEPECLRLALKYGGRCQKHSIEAH